MHLNIFSLLKIGFTSSLAKVRKACIYGNILKIGSIGKGCGGAAYDHLVSALAAVIVGHSEVEVLVGQEVNSPEKAEEKNLWESQKTLEAGENLNLKLTVTVATKSPQ